jgi:Mlc titration factor MtfA (ptsG expression regulator)
MATVESSFRPWAHLDDDERRRLLDLTAELIARKNWEAARGFELTDEIVVTIAVHAALLILELDHRFYRNVSAIIVHPSTVVKTGQRGAGIAGAVTDAPMPILGEARTYGPVSIVWNAASREARHPELGHNVIYHEFAHKLDMLDGSTDGIPPMATSEQAHTWVEVCAREYDLLAAGEGGHLLRAYGAVNPGEFFAVATEVFFDKPDEMLREKPDLYRVLQSFYRQDPAARSAHG